MASRDVREVLAALREVVPFCQVQWAPRKAPELPYGVLMPLDTENTHKDNRTHYVLVPYQIELYSRTRDVPLEKRVQAVLDDMGIGWERSHAIDKNGPAVVTYYYVTLTE